MALSSTSHTDPDAPSSSSANLSYFSYPVKYAVSSALRRLSSDPASTLGLSSRSSSKSKSKPSSLRSSRRTSPERSTYISPSPLPASTLTPILSRSSQPPPLTPLTLAGFRAETPRSARVLDPQLAEEIRLLVPPRLQLADTWRLAFSLEQDGASLGTLFDCAEREAVARAGYVLVVRDGGSAGGAFGAYLSDPPRPSNGHYYGTGECFLWRASVLSSRSTLAALDLPPRPSEDTEHFEGRTVTIGSPKHARHTKGVDAEEDLISFDTDGEVTHTPSAEDDDDDDDWGDFHGGTASPLAISPQISAPPQLQQEVEIRHQPSPTPSTPTPPIRFKAFPYSGLNDYTIFCEHTFLSMGGGDGRYGLFLDGALERGLSGPCPTFGNEVLSEEGSKFDVLGVELWVVGG